VRSSAASPSLRTTKFLGKFDQTKVTPSIPKGQSFGVLAKMNQNYGREASSVAASDHP